MLGFVTGLTAEARLLSGYSEFVAVGGGTPRGAIRAAEALVRQGAAALVSFGLAGGLDPAFRSGDLLVPETIIDAGEAFCCDPSLVKQFGGPTVSLMLGNGTIADTPEVKLNLYTSTHATAIDLESAAVARVAEAHGLKFGVLRAVADPAGKGLPPAALVALDAEGHIAPGQIFASLCRHPLQLPALVSLARDAARARRTLSQALVDYRLRVSTTGT